MAYKYYFSCSVDKCDVRNTLDSELLVSDTLAITDVVVLDKTPALRLDAKSLEVVDAAMAVDLLSQDVYGNPGNGITKL